MSKRPGAGFTRRAMTPRYQIAEGRIVSSPGSDNAVVSLANAGLAVQHLVPPLGAQ
jgi:hypothetical protein